MELKKHLIQSPILMLLLLGVVLLLFSVEALASDGDEWGLAPMVDDVLNFLKGIGGKALGTIGLAIAIYHGVFSLDFKPALIWLGISFLIIGAPHMIDTIFSATI
ncbi:MAG: hypothetical protein V3V61_06240 [Gammaproteobacteria bacterium]